MIEDDYIMELKMDSHCRTNTGTTLQIIKSCYKQCIHAVCTVYSVNYAGGLSWL